MRSPLEHTNRITFELGNYCPYSYLHKGCPVSPGRDPQNLPAKVVTLVLDWAGAEGFKGRIAFHNYSEALVDPRLFQFLARARNSCPDSPIFIMTCGFNLDQVLLDELIEAGVDKVEVSVYRDAMSPHKDEIARVGLLKHKLLPHWSVCQKSHLDSRMTWYDRKPRGCVRPCYAPLATILVNHRADVVHCCMDWRYNQTYGNLRNETLADIIGKGDMEAAYNRLSKGDRFLPLCQRCETTRGDRYGGD